MSDNESPYSPETVKYGISDATLRNWEKLNTGTNGRLTTRANKRKSKKRVFYFVFHSPCANFK